MIPRNQEEPVSVGEWVGTCLLMLLPGLGLIFLIYWAVSSNTNTSKRNYARATLLVVIPLIVLGSVFFAAMAVPAFQKVREQARAKLEATQAGDSSAPPAAPVASVANRVPTVPAAKPPTVVADEPVRQFRSTDGRTIEARVVALTDVTVTIRRADQQEFTTEMTRFSAADVEYFMRLRNGGGAFD